MDILLLFVLCIAIMMYIAGKHTHKKHRLKKLKKNFMSPAVALAIYSFVERLSEDEDGRYLD